MEINIEEIIKGQLAEIDVESVIREEIKNQIKGDVAKSIKKVVEEELNILISSELNSVLSGEIKTDDGWGHRENFEKFEDLFKKTLYKKLNENHNVKSEILKQVERRVDLLVSQKWTEVVSKIVDNITNSHLVKK